MNLIQISVLIIAVQWHGVVKCKPFPRRRHIFKTFHVGFVPLPPPPAPKPISLAWEKITPFGAFEFKHTIEKRQIAQELPPPILNEVKPEEDVPLKVPMLETLEGKEEEKPAEVLITSVVEPLEPGKQISFLLPVDSEVVITPAVKDVAPAVPLAVENPAGPEPEAKPEIVPLPPSVVDITPKPIDLPPPPEVKPVEHVELSTPIEYTVPPILPMPKEEPRSQIAPEVQNVNPPVVRPVINSIPILPFLYTNINGIPFYTPASNVIPFITPAAVPIPEAALAPVPPPKEIPPVVKEEIPVILKEKNPVVVKEITPVVVKEEVPAVVKEEIPPVVKEEVPPPVVKEEPPPNFFVKSSRLVLYVGSMMLQMLSRLVNGQVNFNQIPLPPSIPGLQ